MFERPTSVDEASRLLAETPFAIVAGGTDFYPGLRDQWPAGPVMDISAIEGLRGITEEPEHWRIGALTTWTDLIEHPLPRAFDALKLSAREVGSVQIQNRATIAGNLCNASPAADGVPPLLILDARIELASGSGRRTIELGEFIQGNRRTARRADEIVTAILLPNGSTSGVSHFLKLGARKYLVISIAMVAARLNISAEGTVVDAAVSVGSCSEVALRLGALEEALVGKPVDDLASHVTAEHVSTLTPIDDVRASGQYRRDAAQELLRRSIVHCVSEVTNA